MKTVIRSILFISLLALNMGKSNAQCTVSNIIIQNVRVISSTSNSCTVKFDATFNIESNNGNKFIFIHGWREAEYPNYFECVNGQTTLNGSIAAPTASDLGSSFFNIGLDNTGAIPIVLTTYPPDPSLSMTQMDSAGKVVLPDGSANITLYGVVTTLNAACSSAGVIVADLWSSQSANAQRAHCVNCGIMYSAGYLSITGFVNCSNLTYGGSITNNTNLAINGYYRIFADVNGDGYFTPTTDTLLQSNTPFSVGPSASQSISGPVPGANLNQNVFIVITQTSGAASGASSVTLFRSSQCSPLPVTFGLFSATRINSTSVALRWETVTEINNNGFVVQRNTGTTDWELVTFINTQATGGNSNSPIHYSFNDMNTSKGITQYRIKQVDFDGKAKFSEIRAVRGNDQKSKIIIYPNPSSDGRVNIVFDDQKGTRDVTIYDMSGRIFQQWTGISNNTLQVKQLNAGMYMLRVIIKETGSQSMEKIIVTKY